MRLALISALLAGALCVGYLRRTPSDHRERPAARGRQEAELSKYLASCALGEGESIVLSIDAELRTFRGQFGLARTWWSGTVTRREQRWTTACLLARTNLFERRVLVSMRGAHPGLRSHEGGEGTHTVQEGAFYGDIFDEPSRVYACRGARASASAALADRVCTEPEGTSSRTRCGFIDAGACSDVCELDAEGGYYRRCRGGAELYDEVTTVYLEPAPTE